MLKWCEEVTTKKCRKLEPGENANFKDAENVVENDA